MRINMRIDMCIDMRIDMHVDMCLDLSWVCIMHGWKALVQACLNGLDSLGPKWTRRVVSH